MLTGFIIRWLPGLAPRSISGKCSMSGMFGFKAAVPGSKLHDQSIGLRQRMRHHMAVKEKNGGLFLVLVPRLIGLKGLQRRMIVSINDIGHEHRSRAIQGLRLSEPAGLPIGKVDRVVGV